LGGYWFNWVIVSFAGSWLLRHEVFALVSLPASVIRGLIFTVLAFGVSVVGSKRHYVIFAIYTNFASTP
jgi:hypothetical protein